ncbi:MAG: hypothetical protein N4A49_13135 [Marinifilaceae bacterium]|jgi:hypothetical protein|nr:hypothetical protein [Marinifilaceae bacterium]
MQTNNSQKEIEKRLRKKEFILEIIWLIVLIASLTGAIYKTYTTSFSKGMVLYIIAGLSLMMYSSRRYLRKTRENNSSK